MRTWQKFGDWFLAFDPGYLNLRNAIRGTLAVTTSYLCLSWLSRTLETAPTMPFLGVLMALLASIVVSDVRERDQKITTLLLALPTTIASVISVLLSEFAYGRLAMFLIITFVGVSVRRFGLRYVALGTITFMAYFSTLFFPFHIQDIYLMAPAIIFSIGLAYIARFWILPDRPSRLLKLYTKAFDLKVNAILRELGQALQSIPRHDILQRGDEPSPLWKLVRKSFVQINELSLTIEQFFDAIDTPSIRSKSDRFRLKAFEQEVALRRLWDYSFEFLHGRSPDADFYKRAAQAIELLAQRASKARLLESIEDLQTSFPDENIGPFVASLRNVNKTLETQEFVESDIQTAVDEINVKSSPTQTPARPPAHTILGRIESLHTNTRQAIQATLATALASLLGTSLSPERWYWASIAAFTVFIGATRGETMMRAVLRIIGTVLGLVLGFGLAYAFSGMKGFEWTLIVGCVFFGIFGARMTFGFWTASLFSSMFALFFDILGLLSKEILILRVEETLVGALIGVVVAAIVLPTSTHSVIRDALSEYLKNLAALLSSISQESPNPFARRTLIRQLRSLDKDLLAVRVASLPILGRGSLMKQGDLPGALHDATMLAHYFRHLAIHVDPKSEMSDLEFESACQSLSERFVLVAEAIKIGKVFDREMLPWSEISPKNMAGPKHSLERIRIGLASLAARKF